MDIVKENDKALLIRVPEDSGANHFEVWMRMERTVGKDKGKLIEPKDEDFGVWAWNYYSLPRAERCFDEITTGKRGIRPMVEVSEF